MTTTLLPGRAGLPWYPPRVSDALWTRLAAPFPVPSVTWDVVSVDPGADEALVVPRLRRVAIVERLDELCGVAGWSVSYTPFADGAVGCFVQVGEVRKAAVVDARVEGPATTADAALAACAALLGLTAPVAGRARRVAFDAEAGVVLHEPDLAEDLAEGPGMGITEPSGASGSAEAAGGDGVAVPDDALETVGLGARRPSSEARAMIDRLVERLRASGRGLEVARLVARHGGYGEDAEAARALYGALRALLKRAAADEVEA